MAISGDGEGLVQIDVKNVLSRLRGLLSSILSRFSDRVHLVVIVFEYTQRPDFNIHLNSTFELCGIRQQNIATCANRVVCSEVRINEKVIKI